MLIFKSKKPPEDSVPGLITVLNWTMAPNGNKYLFFWAPRWQIMTDKEMPTEHFRSSERWQLAAITSNSDVLAVFPGCQVKAWIHCETPPEKDCFAFNIE
ncbi:MAG: hypothetical protein KAJ19_17800 [Gammaproteobacteria bacterium]|nr:hypothetical protein [Gammaproteobacteria bacterium]